MPAPAVASPVNAIAMAAVIVTVATAIEEIVPLTAEGVVTVLRIEDVSDAMMTVWTEIVTSAETVIKGVTVTPAETEVEAEIEITIGEETLVTALAIAIITALRTETEEETRTAAEVTVTALETVQDRATAVRCEAMIGIAIVAELTVAAAVETVGTVIEVTD